MSKPPKDLLGAEFANLKIASPADCYCTSMAKGFPKPLRTPYRGGRTWTSNGVTGDDAVIHVIEQYDGEIGNLGHESAFPRSPSFLSSVHTAQALAVAKHDLTRPGKSQHTLAMEL